ncbi:ABC transporter, subfamily B, ATP-binding & transmembrane domain [Pelomyxa schiedti]|nr:ABC transporter, subfamily B, ATP-binding & transmembrane domain [Pelomyxa schiedti]
MTMRVELVKRGGVAYCTVDVPEDGTVENLMRVVEATKRLGIARQRITDEKGQRVVVLEREKTLKHYGIKSGDQLFIKDLGTQLPFRMVYLIEYFGPLFIYPLFALRLIPWAYPGEKLYPLTITQQGAFFLWMLHYAKREVETVLVHEFGYLTMPVFNLFKNTAYYWGFACWIGWQVNYPVAHKLPAWHFCLGFTIFLTGLICNFICHMMLKALRTPGTAEWKMPRGFLFEYVTMPNYTMEILTWIGFAVLMNFPISVLCFICCATYQMTQWARERHAKYLKLFPDYPKHRKILFPFIY